jgi:GDP-L-fucose synthase
VNDLVLRTHAELDLRNQAAVEEFFAAERPEVVILAAARVGGIQANRSFPAEFIYDNLAIAANTIHAAYRNGCRRLVYLGSTCIYPRDAPQPMSEACLLTAPLEPTNEPYAVAKIAGVKLCQAYRRQYGVLYHSAIPTNLYGPGDNYHPEHSHVMAAMIRRFHEAKASSIESVTIWGTGRPRRELLHVDDAASAIMHLLTLDDPPDLVNIGAAVDATVLELAQLVAEVVGYEGTIDTDPSKPDGVMMKRTNSNLLTATGWQPQIELRAGIEETYREFLADQAAGRLRE